MIGQIVDGKYQLTRLLGKGGMGAVYEARHVGTGRRVALKVILASALSSAPELVRRFQLEARASGSIESDHVVQVLDTGVDPATENPYMVMELLNGEDVQQLTERVGAVDQDVSLKILQQACLGLKKAHEAGIVHRDIKSANLFLSRRDSGEILVKLLDFGIAKMRVEQFAATGNHALTRTGSMMGSPLYMSPEQAQGAKGLDHRSDIWSLGIVLYEALTGEAPHADCPTLGALIVAICSRPVPDIRDRAHGVRPEIAEIVHKALALDPSQRYQSASEMHDAISALLPDGGVLHESMFVGMPNTVRAPAAARFASTAPAPAAGGPALDLPLPPLWGMTPGAGHFSHDPLVRNPYDSRPSQDPRMIPVAANSDPGPNGYMGTGGVNRSNSGLIAGFGDSSINPPKAARSPLLWVLPLGGVLMASALVLGMTMRKGGHNETPTALSAAPSQPGHGAAPYDHDVAVTPGASVSAAGQPGPPPKESAEPATTSSAAVALKPVDHAASAKPLGTHQAPGTSNTAVETPKTAPTVQRTFE